MPKPSRSQKVAADIGPGLAKAALAGKVDGKLVDTSDPIDRDAKLADRHGRRIRKVSRSFATRSRTCSAQAVKQLYPDAQMMIGPVIEDGFYYDIAYERPFTPEDLDGDRSADARAGRKATTTSSRRVTPRDEVVEVLQGAG